MISYFLMKILFLLFYPESSFVEISEQSKIWSLLLVLMGKFMHSILVFPPITCKENPRGEEGRYS